ncbi:MAG: ADP-ribosylglycohydrolase family protein [Rhodocyclaceae bacterium]|nr:ADP-ribosylglycohydrolase family protein [Rhodocyclaceae bacterium]
MTTPAPAPSIPPAMSGTLIGDIAGSSHEGRYDKVVPQELIVPNSRFTDDTVLSCAVAQGLVDGLTQVGRDAAARDPQAQQILLRTIGDALHKFARTYPHAGYGGNFKVWMNSDNPQPYNSYGNGAPMRAAFAGWCAATLEEAECFGTLCARPTHNHPTAEEAAAVVAACIYLLKTGGNKRDVLQYAQTHYDLSFTLDALRPVHAFNITAKGTLIAALVCFLESTSFADSIGLAISLGGDCDTLAAITGSIAEAHYRIDPNLLHTALAKLDAPLAHTLHHCTAYLRKENLWHPGEKETDEALRCHCQWSV